MVNDFYRELRDSRQEYIKVDGRDISCFILQDGTIFTVNTWEVTIYADEAAFLKDEPLLSRAW